MTIKSTAVMRITNGLLDRMNQNSSSTLCSEIENFHADMLGDLKNELKRVSYNDPQVISTFIDKFTDFKILNMMFLSCKKANLPAYEPAAPPAPIQQPAPRRRSPHRQRDPVTGRYIPAED